VQSFLREDLVVFCREAPPGTLPSHFHPISLYTNTYTEFNDHQRDVFCVFSGTGVSRLRNYLNIDSNASPRGPVPLGHATMYDESEEPEMVLDVTSRAGGMAIDDLDDEFESEMLGQD
jgi:F-box and leucine-rich repeat protein GRR1